MTTTPEATKGVPRHEGNSTFTPRADHNALADWVLENVDGTTANALSLPATGNWVGRTLTTLDKKTVYRWNGTGWALFYAPWEAYTPTTSNISGGTINAAWTRLGDVVHVRIVHTLSGANFTGQPSYTLPVNHVDSAVEWLDGAVMLRDESGSAEYHGIIRKVSETTVSPFVSSVISSYVRINNVTATVPFTWASTDVLIMNFSYRSVDA